jgi:hypothetical protein
MTDTKFALDLLRVDLVALAEEKAFSQSDHDKRDVATRNFIEVARLTQAAMKEAFPVR